MTPGQVSLGSNFVTDVATQGPTDEGLRRANCRFAQSLKSTCVDCKGPIPSWALGERLSLGGREITGFIGAQTYTATPGSVWKLTMQVSRPLTAEECAGAEQSYRAALPAVGVTVLHFSCDGALVHTTVQYGAMTPAQPIIVGTPISMAGMTITLISAEQLNAPSPTTSTQTGLSTGAMFGLGIAAGAVVAGGVVYAVKHRR